MLRHRPFLVLSRVTQRTLVCRREVAPGKNLGVCFVRSWFHIRFFGDFIEEIIIEEIIIE